VAKARLDARRARQSDLRLLGVLPRPQPETAHLLGALAETEGVVLRVLYAAGETEAEQGALPYGRWFMRGFRVAALERALGREYPINWAIWNSFRRFGPHCMLVSDLGTFAGQASVLWCTAFRIPYVVVGRDGELAADSGRPNALVRLAVRRAAGVVTADDPAAEAAELVRLAGLRSRARRRRSRFASPGRPA
jgi:hypothetical protein